LPARPAAVSWNPEVRVLKALTDRALGRPARRAGPRAGQAAGVEGRRADPAGQGDRAVGPEPVGGVDHDLVGKRPGRGERPVDRAPRHRAHHQVAERDGGGGGTGAGAGANRGGAARQVGRVAGEAEQHLVAGLGEQAPGVGADPTRPTR